MARLPLRTRESLPPDQQHLYDEIQGSRGGQVANVFRTLLNSPEAAARVARLGAYLRFESSLTPVQRELAILATARELDCTYELTHHERLAAQAGVRGAAIDVISQRKAPAGLLPDEAAIVTYAQELIRQRHVSEPTFQTALNLLGEQGVMDLTLTVGYYNMLAFALLALEVELER